MFHHQAFMVHKKIAQVDAEISTPETKACILEQLQKETEAPMAGKKPWDGYMDFFGGKIIWFTTKKTIKVMY